MLLIIMIFVLIANTRMSTLKSTNITNAVSIVVIFISGLRIFANNAIRVDYVAIVVQMLMLHREVWMRTGKTAKRTNRPVKFYVLASVIPMTIHYSIRGLHKFSICSYKYISFPKYIVRRTKRKIAINSHYVSKGLIANKIVNVLTTVTYGKLQKSNTAMANFTGNLVGMTTNMAAIIARA